MDSTKDSTVQVEVSCRDENCNIQGDSKAADEIPVQDAPTVMLNLKAEEGGDVAENYEKIVIAENGNHNPNSQAAEVQAATISVAVSPATEAATTSVLSVATEMTEPASTTVLSAGMPSIMDTATGTKIPKVVSTVTGATDATITTTESAASAATTITESTTAATTITTELATTTTMGSATAIAELAAATTTTTESVVTTITLTDAVSTTTTAESAAAAGSATDIDSPKETIAPKTVEPLVSENSNNSAIVSTTEPEEHVTNGIAEPESELAKEIPIYSDPGNVFQWRDDLIDKRDMDDLDKYIEHEVNFYCNSYGNNGDAQVLISTQPAKFLAFNCIQSVHLAFTDNFDSAYNVLLRTKNFFRLYYEEIEEFYDLDGIFYFLNLTLKKLYEKDPGNPKRPDLYVVVDSWDELSPEAQSIVFAVQLYYFILVREPVSVLNNICKKMLRLRDNVPEWHFLQWLVQRLKRHQNNPVIVKPKKTEMNALRKALELDLPNIALRIAKAQTLFDWMRTDDRVPQVELMGDYMRSVDDVSYLLHTEIQELLKAELPLVYQLEVNLMACSFYGYKNLSEILYPVESKADLKAEDKVTELDNKLYKVLVSRLDAQRVSGECLNRALQLDPESTRANLINAYRDLKMFQRDRALYVLRCCKALEPLSEEVALAYIRASVGGTEEDRAEALEFINETLASEFKHPPLVTAHFYFIKGCLLWLGTNIEGCVNAWVEGLYYDVDLFLSQFSFWTKTHIRKYLWPTCLGNFAVIESLKAALRKFAFDPDTQKTKNLDARIPGACKAFLQELDEMFPLTTPNAQTIAKLTKRWFYLIDRDASYDNSSDSSDPGDEGPPNKVQVIATTAQPDKPQPIARRHANPNLIELIPQDLPQPAAHRHANSNLIELTPQKVPQPAARRHANPNLIEIIPEDQPSQTQQTAAAVANATTSRLIDLTTAEKVQVILIDDDDEDVDEIEEIIMEDDDEAVGSDEATVRAGMGDVHELAETGGPEESPETGGAEDPSETGGLEHPLETGRPEEPPEMGGPEEQAETGGPEEQAEAVAPGERAETLAPEEQSEAVETEEPAEYGEPKEPSVMGEPEELAETSEPDQCVSEEDIVMETDAESGHSISGSDVDTIEGSGNETTEDSSDVEIIDERPPDPDVVIIDERPRDPETDIYADMDVITVAVPEEVFDVVDNLCSEPPSDDSLALKERQELPALFNHPPDFESNGNEMTE